MGDTVLKVDGDRSRTEVASTLRALAEQLDRGEEVRLVGDGETISVVPANELAFELEVEEESNGDREIEVEIELEWTEPSEPPGDAVTESDESDELPNAEASPAAPEDPDVDKVVPDDSETIASLARFEVFQDRADEWRWRLVHRNGNIIASSGEGYTTRQNAEKGMRSVMRNAPGASVQRGE